MALVSGMSPLCRKSAYAGELGCWCVQCLVGLCLALTWSWNAARRELGVGCTVPDVWRDTRWRCVERRTAAASLVVSVVVLWFPSGGSLWCWLRPRKLRSRVSISSSIRSRLVQEARKHTLGKSLAHVSSVGVALWSAPNQQVPVSQCMGPFMAHSA
jgi:hypothetical protein